MADIYSAYKMQKSTENVAKSPKFCTFVCVCVSARACVPAEAFAINFVYLCVSKPTGTESRCGYMSRGLSGC